MPVRHSILIALASLFLTGGVITAPAADGNDSPITGALAGRLADKLDLTDDQKLQIKDILATEKDTVRPLMQNLKSARKELRTAIQADNTTEAAVRTASAKVAVVEADLAVERMKLYARIAPILTDAQKQKLANFD